MPHLVCNSTLVANGDGDQPPDLDDATAARIAGDAYC